MTAAASLSLRGALLLVSLAAVVVVAQDESQPTEDPTLEKSLSAPLYKKEGESAYLTCVVRNILDHTLLWKDKNGTILTAGEARVTQDKRFSVVHDDGGEVYVLSITNLTLSDSGTYVCELNTEPTVSRIFRTLSVLSSSLTAPPVSTDSNGTPEVNTENGHKARDSMDVWGFSTPSPVDHDYTKCCRAQNVSDNCLGFCNIKNILEANTNASPADCEDQFQNIVRCMADGKNHVPCCTRSKIPDVCQDMCVGQYREQTNDARTHISCSTYTAQTLSCIAEGISTLPGPPEEPEVSHVTDSMFILKWKMFSGRANKIERYVITVEEIGQMNHNSLNRPTATLEGKPHAELITVDGGTTKANVTGLKPFTLYNVTIVAENTHGQSLPSYAIRVVTRTNDEASWSKIEPDNSNLPKLPDTVSCCAGKNITHKSCVKSFCDPHSLRTVGIPDLMICAPWAGDMLSCLYDGQNHTDCCSQQDVPEVCQEICDGSVKAVSFRHFVCIQHLPKIVNCAMKKFDVLPSEPRNFRFSNIGTNIGLLHWDVPLRHGDSVASYVVHYKNMDPRAVTPQDHVFRTIQNTFVMENLEPDSSYETYVGAENTHGVGDFSTRIVFRTAKRSAAFEKDPDLSYNHEKCCQDAKVDTQCMPLCRFNVSMSDVRELSTFCAPDLGKLAKCAVGGRDHMPCCLRRGVPDRCQLLCQGIQLEPHSSVYTDCFPYIGNIMTCLEQGFAELPPPVKNFHAIFVGDDRITLEWDKEKPIFNITTYEVYYKELQNNSNTAASLFTGNKNISIADSSLTIFKLSKDQLHQFFVIARNSQGTSLPSAVLHVNISAEAWDGSKIKGLPTAPHQIVVTRQGTDFLSLAWTGPAVSDPNGVIKYRIYYREFVQGPNTTNSVETSVNTLTLSDLLANNQYIIYMTTLEGDAESKPSETIVAWTDPIVPAFAEAPLIQPSEGIREGSAVSVLCIAMGSPTPTITLYIAGHPVRSEQTRHMVTTIHNLTRHMRRIGCHADNGYGTPMHSTRTINIDRRPRIVEPKQGRFSVFAGQDFSIACILDAHPVPLFAIGRTDGHLVIGGRVSITANVTTVDDSEYSMRLNISNVVESDAGEYYCKANNSIGTVFRKFTLDVMPPRSQYESSSSCCAAQNVSDSCSGICSLSIDLDFLLYRPECFADFEKLMFCASDGSDHRHCCSVSGVPGPCLDWCRGKPVDDSSEFCALTHARKIARCFDEGRFTLPGAPTNIHVTPINSHSAKASWEPPEKNPESVELYRILWREMGNVHAVDKIDTEGLQVVLDNLKPGVTYELVVKAGNANGTSQLSAPLQFFTADNYFVETQNVYSPVPSVVGVVVAVLLLVPLVAVLVWLFKQKKLSLPTRLGLSNNSSFENPILSQEVTMSHLQHEQQQQQSAHYDAMTENPRDEAEHDPTLFEELKNMREGGGFKRLK